MTPSPPPTAELEQAAKPLEWEEHNEDGQDSYCADSHVYEMTYEIILGEDGFMLTGTEGLIPAGTQTHYDYLDDAKAAAQRIEDDEAEACTPPDDAEEPDAIRRERDVLRKHDTEARKLAEDAAEKRRRWEASKKQTAKLKKDYEEAAEQLIQHAQDRPTFGPLFDGEGDQAGASDEQSSATGHDPEGWRDVDLDELGIPHTLGKKLIEHDPPLSTLGAIADFTQEHRLTDIKGVGPTAAEQIEDATAAYWAKHPPAKAEPEATAWDGEPEGRPLRGFVSDEAADRFEVATGHDPEAVAEPADVSDYLAVVEEFGEAEHLRTLCEGQPQQLQASIKHAHDTIRRYAKLNGIWPLADDDPDTDEDDEDQPDAG